MDKYLVHYKGRWSFCSPFLRIVDPILKALQFWSDRPFLFYACVAYGDDGRLHFVEYGFGRVSVGDA